MPCEMRKESALSKTRAEGQKQSGLLDLDEKFKDVQYGFDDFPRVGEQPAKDRAGGRNTRNQDDFSHIASNEQCMVFVLINGLAQYRPQILRCFSR